jgi:hypothetical protein
MNRIEPEPCSRAGAIKAGHRFTAERLCQGLDAVLLVMRHGGGAGGRWRLVDAIVGHGEAVAAYKRARGDKADLRGVVALWERGRLSRYEQGSLSSSASRIGAAQFAKG